MHLPTPQLRVGNRETYAAIWEWHLHGTNREIGRTLGSYGRDQVGAAPRPCSDIARIRAQRRFFEARFRPYHQRMLGVADAFGLPGDEPTHDLSTLWFDVQLPGCSAGFVPKQQTEDGHSYVLRNMDLGVDLTGDVGHPPASRILALAMTPDKGYASLSVVVFDLMGAMDGINEKGLVVVCNSHGDYRLTGGFRPEPAYTYDPVRQPEPGFNELQVVRFLLDMCADADEAMEALLSLRTYYMFTPSLYLVADARGRSVAFEKSPSGNRIIPTQRDGEPLVMTNFARSRFGDATALPEGDGLDQGFVYERYRIVKCALESEKRLTRAQLADIAREASFDVLCGPRTQGDEHPVRTIYTSIYDIESRAMDLSCYLGETETGTIHSSAIRLGLTDTAESPGGGS